MSLICPFLTKCYHFPQF